MLPIRDCAIYRQNVEPRPDDSDVMGNQEAQSTIDLIEQGDNTFQRDLWRNLVA